MIFYVSLLVKLFSSSGRNPLKCLMILSNSEQFYGFGAGVVDYEVLMIYKPRTALYVKNRPTLNVST